MRISVLFAVLVIASILAGVLSGASQGLATNPPGDSLQSQSQNEIISPSL